MSSRLPRPRLLVGLLVGLYAVPVMADVRVPDFNPNEPIFVDKRFYGKALPDPQMMEKVFSTQYDQLDACIAEHKGRTGQRAQLLGDALSSVILNPKGGMPDAVHTEIPEEYARHKALVDCLRIATASADWPAYDGAPAIVSFEFELDPDFIECEPNDKRDECK